MSTGGTRFDVGSSTSSSLPGVRRAAPSLAGIVLVLSVLAAAALATPASAQMTLNASVSPHDVSYTGGVTYSASASGGDPYTTQYAFFRRRPGGTWTPSVYSPTWQSSGTYTWYPTQADVGTWETYVWTKDANTPPSASGGYGYAAGVNTMPVQVYGPPTVPGPTDVSCAYTSSDNCWVTGDFTVSASASSGGFGSISYQICRSNDTSGWGGCDSLLTNSGSNSIWVSGSHLPSDGYRRAYYFQARDSGGAYSGWNSPRYVRVDRYSPAVSATDASDYWFSNRTPTLFANDNGGGASANSGLQDVRYQWNSPLNGTCTNGTGTYSGVVLTAPAGDNVLYACARDNTGRVSQWNGRYRISPIGLTGSIAPSRDSYLRCFTYTANASGGTPSTYRYSFFRRRPGGTWIPDVYAPTWQTANTFTWCPQLADVGTWETYIWVKDADTPASASGGYGYAAGWNTMPIEVVGKPTVPGGTTVACPYTSGGDCWVAGDFTASVAASSGGMGTLVYQICRSNDTTGWGGCDANLTLSGGTSITVSAPHLAADGYKRAYYFQASDSAGALSGWNAPIYVRVDRYAPAVSASNASTQWFASRTATVSASDVTGGTGTNSGVAAVRYNWNAALDAGCTGGTATSSGATLTAPVGDNVLYLCARDNVGRVAQWSGQYRVSAPLAITSCACSPASSSYTASYTCTATTSGGVPASTVFSFFRRRPGGVWFPDVNAPAWQAAGSKVWTSAATDAGDWENYVWAKDDVTPNNSYGYAAGCNPGPTTIVGAPTVPGPTTVACAYSSGGDCWVPGDFTASAAASTGGSGGTTYQICRSNDTNATGGCDVNLTLSGGTSIVVSSPHLASDGYKRAYYFQAKDSAGAPSGWNVPAYVRIDRYAPSVSASNASDTIWYSYRTAVVSAADATVSAAANSGVAAVRYNWGAPLDAGCTTGTATSAGATLVAPNGDNLLYLCARDNTSRVSQWSGRYRVSPIALSGSITPQSTSYAGSFTYTASASGGTPSTYRYAFFRRRPNGTWIPDVNNPTWYTSNVFTWSPTQADVGTWETYIWVKDADTPASASGGYGYAAGVNTMPVEVLGPPTVPGPTTATCAYSAAGDCWTTGDFTISAAASTGGTGGITYQICRSSDTTTTGACAVDLATAGGTSILVSGTHLPGDGYRRAYYFQAKDNKGGSSGFNTPLYARVDRYAPTVSASNASSSWFPSRTAVVSAADATSGAGTNSGLAAVRYAWNSALDAGCTTGTATANGASLDAPSGDNVLYLCARDNTSRVAQWNGSYRVSAPLTISSCSASPRNASYLSTFTITASASGGVPASTRFAFFRRRPGAPTWIPDVSAPSWQTANSYAWHPAQADAGTWETYVWAKDDVTPNNQYGYAAGCNSAPIEVVGPPTMPGPTVLGCDFAAANGDCWVAGESAVNASVTASTGGMGTLVYEVCRSNDSVPGGLGKCDVNLATVSGTSFLIPIAELPGDAFRRAFYFRAKDSAGATSAWNLPAYLRADRNAPEVSATNSSDEWFTSRTATVVANDEVGGTDANSGLGILRYAWNLDIADGCEGGTDVAPGATLQAPPGDNWLNLCARDNVGWTVTWSGHYRVSEGATLTGTVSPRRASYLGSFTYTATATGVDEATKRFAFFRRRPGEVWIPDVHAPNWQPSNQFTWHPTTVDDAGTWETYIWVKDANTPASANNGYGYAAGFNTMPIEVVGKPTVPGATAVNCVWTTGDDCWVQGDFTASVAPSTGGMDALVYQICRSNDSTGGVAGCDIELAPAGGTSIVVSGAHLATDGFRRAYTFQAKDTAGALSGWNVPRYVRVDRHAPVVSATNASEDWFPSRTATVAAADDNGGAAANSGLAEVRYGWNEDLGAACTNGTVVTPGATLNAPDGDNTLNLCARDQVGRVGYWSGHYRVGEPNFSISATPLSVTVDQGSSAHYTVTLSAAPGFTGTATLGLTDLPGGTSYAFAPAAIGAGGSSVLTLSTTHNAAEGTSDLTITATVGSVVRTAEVEITIRAQSAGAPHIDSISPDVVVNGAVRSFTLVGRNFQGSTVTIATDDPNPNVPTSRAFPTLSHVTISADGTRITLDADCTDPAILDFYNVSVVNANGHDAAQFRVLPPGPLVDAWTPREAETGGIYVLSIVGKHLHNVSVSANPGGRITLYGVDTSDDDQVSGLLEVAANAPAGDIEITVQDSAGRIATFTITIVGAGQATIVSEDLTARPQGVSIATVDGSTPVHIPRILSQEYAVRSPDTTEVTAVGEVAAHAATPAEMAAPSPASVSFYFSFRYTLLNIQWQRAFVFNPLTGALGDDMLKNLVIGDKVPVAAFVLSFYLRVDLTVYYYWTSYSRYTFPLFCVTITSGVEITGFDGIARQWNYCRNLFELLRGKGSLTQGNIKGGACARPVYQDPPQDGIMVAAMEQTDCCEQPVEVDASGSTFPGLYFGKNFSIAAGGAAKTTAAEGCSTCSGDDAGESRTIFEGDSAFLGSVDKGACVRFLLGPGKFQMSGASPTQLSGLAIIPEETTNVTLATSNGVMYEGDGLFVRGQPCEPGTSCVIKPGTKWYKVPDHCTATLVFSAGDSRSFYVDACCNLCGIGIQQARGKQSWPGYSNDCHQAFSKNPFCSGP